jgi:hypothetical protein
MARGGSVPTTVRSMDWAKGAVATELLSGKLGDWGKGQSAQMV